MLKIFPYNAVSFERGIILADAFSVRVTHEINGVRMLEFLHPVNENAELLEENKIVVCEGQAYRIMKLEKTMGAQSLIRAECHHVYNADAPNTHIQNIPNMMGVNPTEVIRRAIKNTNFSLISDASLAARGMRRVDHDGFKIDFFSTDKTNPFDVMQRVIENCGKGEIYADNYNIALVERIGRDRHIRLDMTKNMQSISVERDITDMVTRIYPYGADDAHIGSVNGGVQYIQSANASVYGVRDGYREYSDYTEPKKIKERAMWEFDSANEERIDVPCINITGTYADISKIAEYGDSEKINLGDTVTVIDCGNEIAERVIKMEYYPFESDNTVISIGRVKKDLFFYLNQIGALTRGYGKVSTSSGKVKAGAVAGVIKNSGISVATENGAVSILSDVINITSGGAVKARLGNVNGAFICEIADNNSQNAIEIGEDGKMRFNGVVTASSVTVGDNVISVDENGALCINGKEIQTR